MTGGGNTDSTEKYSSTKPIFAMFLPYLVLGAGVLTFVLAPLFKSPDKKLHEEYQKIVQKEIGTNPTKYDSLVFYRNHGLNKNFMGIDEKYNDSLFWNCYIFKPIPDSAMKRIVGENKLEKGIK
jgi:hypothetical protein